MHRLEPLKVGGWRLAVGGWRVSDYSGSTTHFIFWGTGLGRGASDERKRHTRENRLQSAGPARTCCEPYANGAELGQQEGQQGRVKRKGRMTEATKSLG